MKTLPVLVTGGAGYIGSHTCKALAAGQRAGPPALEGRFSGLSRQRRKWKFGRRLFAGGIRQYLATAVNEPGSVLCGAPMSIFLQPRLQCALRFSYSLKHCSAKISAGGSRYVPLEKRS